MAVRQMAYLRSMRLPMAASWRWGSARRVFGFGCESMANRNAGFFCATRLWFYRSRSRAQEVLVRVRERLQNPYK